MVNVFNIKQKPAQKILKWTLAGLVAAGMGIGSIALAASKATAKPKTVERVDLEKYLGDWYEIAHLPMFFQRKCASNTTASYRLTNNKKIEVLNQCQTATGKKLASTGVATAVDKTNSKLKVSFLPKGLRWVPFTKGDYWVLKVDDNYQTALVGGPSHKYLWILSRTPQIDEAVYQSYVQAAQEQGYDTSKLIRNPHL
jgi:apolipoprotein D and lipocalin family protein